VVALLTSGAVADTTRATTNTGPEGTEDVATASTSPATDETSGVWSHFRGDAAHTGVADAGPTGKPVEVWHLPLSDECHRQAAVVAGVVYAPCNHGLHVVDAATGSERWMFEGTNIKTATVAGDLVYVTDREPGDSTELETTVVRAIDTATGQERWHVAVSNGWPVVDDGVLVTGTSEGFLLGLDAATGAERWRYQVSTQNGAGNAALADGVAYVGAGAEGFFAVDASSGTLLWRGDIDDDRTGTAVVAEGIAYLGGATDNETGHLYAFDAKSGDLMWTREGLASPAVLDGVGYSGSDTGTLYAFNTVDGTERWQKDLGGFVANPAVANGVVYVVSLNDPIDATLLAVDAATGDELWSYTVEPVLTGASVGGGRAFLDTADYKGIYAIGGTDQGAVAVTTTPSSSPDTAATTTM
jgi:outer membrane protein assembly factor BamB